MEKAINFFDLVESESEARGFARGFAKGEAKAEIGKTADAIISFFPLAFDNEKPPAKLCQLISSLRIKGDADCLKKLKQLQQYMALRKGSIEDFLRYAESITDL